MNGRPFGGAVQHALAVLDGGADREELGELAAPLVAADVEAHADDAVGAELVGLFLHARHRELAGVVHRLASARPSPGSGSSCPTWKPTW